MHVCDKWVSNKGPGGVCKGTEGTKAVGKMLENAGFVNTRVTGYGVGKFPDFRTYAIAQRPLKFTSYMHQGLPFYPC